MQRIAGSKAILKHGFIHCVQIGCRNIHQGEVGVSAELAQARGELGLEFADHLFFLIAQLVQGRTRIVIANECQ